MRVLGGTDSPLQRAIQTGLQVSTEPARPSVRRSTRRNRWKFHRGPLSSRAAITDTAAVKTRLIASADPDRLETWARYSNGLCRDCQATCCTLPVEVRIDDLIRLELVDAFERDEPPKNVAKRLSKAGIVEHFNQKHGIFTLTRLANGDCLYLDRKTRLCTVYAKRPDTCRNHPRIGPRPGYCAYQLKTAAR